MFDLASTFTLCLLSLHKFESIFIMVKILRMLFTQVLNMMHKFIYPQLLKELKVLIYLMIGWIRDSKKRNSHGLTEYLADSLKFLAVTGMRIRSLSTRRLRRKWQSREERKRIDIEYDIVIVLYDRGSMSGLDSENFDWSVGRSVGRSEAWSLMVRILAGMQQTALLSWCLVMGGGGARMWRR